MKLHTRLRAAGLAVALGLGGAAACGQEVDISAPGWDGAIDCDGNVVESNPPGAVYEPPLLVWYDEDGNVLDTDYPDKPDDCEEEPPTTPPTNPPTSPPTNPPTTPPTTPPTVPPTVPDTTTPTTLPATVPPTVDTTTPDTTAPVTVPPPPPPPPTEITTAHTQPEPWCVSHPNTPGCTPEGLNTADAG